MTSSDTTSSPVTEVVTTQPTDACDACVHSLSSHDAISLRFCQATVTAALSRACVCPV